MSSNITTMPAASPIQTQGLHHLGLSVADIHACSEFFCRELNFIEVGEIPDYPARFVSDGTIMLTLWQVHSPETVPAFDRHHTIGLHHFALKVADKTALNTLHQHLSSLADVSIEFAPEPLRDGPLQHMMCSIPGGLRVEFITAA